MSGGTMSASQGSETETEDLKVAALACKRALTRLATLSGASASRMRDSGMLVHGTMAPGLRTRGHEPMSVHGHRDASTQIPAGVRVKVGQDMAPSKDRSLHDHYLWRMRRALGRKDHAEALLLAAEADREYELMTGRRKPLRFGDHDGAVTYLLSTFNGVSAERAAVEMKTPDETFKSAVRWVRQQRVQNGHDPETGALTELDERTRRVFALAAAGATQKTIGAELGLSQSQVSRILRKTA